MRSSLNADPDDVDSNAEDPSGARLVWLRAGQRLLRQGGVGAVKIHALQEEVGLTTGSFYYQFAGMSDYLDALADLWGYDTPGHIAEAEAPDPRTRLLDLTAIPLREDLVRLDRAMRDWAGSNSRAAAAVKRVDAVLLNFVAEAFAELGFKQADARLCAQVMIATGVARVNPPWPADKNQAKRLLDLLTRSPGSSVGS